jgi:hypothetical protein
VARRTTASATWSSSNSRDGAPRVFLSGPSGGPCRYTKPAMTRVTGVRLRPGVGYLLRRRPMCALVNRRVRCPAPELVRQMAGAQRLDGTSLGPRVSAAAQLERLMRVWVGVSPKRLARVARFSIFARQCGRWTAERLDANGGGILRRPVPLDSRVCRIRGRLRAAFLCGAERGRVTCAVRVERPEAPRLQPPWAITSRASETTSGFTICRKSSRRTWTTSRCVPALKAICSSDSKLLSR